MHSVSEAESRIFKHLPSFPAEPVPLLEAAGRVLREALRADRPLPPYHRATMDGIALRAEAAGRDLQIEHTQFAGAPPGRLEDPERACHRIMTGAAVPDQADCVVPVEWLTETGNHVHITPRAGRDIQPGMHIHRMGSDRDTGAILLGPGTRLTPPRIAIAAAVGQAEVSVTIRPRVALISTGDELVEPGLPIAPQQIRPSSTYGLATALQGLGCDPVRMHLPDDPLALAEGLQAALDTCHVLVSSGGVSKGGKDFLPAVLDSLAVTEHLHRVQQRPGRPMWFGTRGDVPVFALPGNPVSTLVCFRRFVHPALEQALGLPPAPPQHAVLSEAVHFPPSLTHFCPVSIRPGNDGRRHATPMPTNTSGDFAALGMSDGFLELPAAPGEFPAGSAHPFFPW